MRTLLLASIFSLVLTCTAAARDFTPSHATTELHLDVDNAVSAVGMDPFSAVRRRLQGGGWVLNSGCYAGQTCTRYTGLCLSAATYTSYNSTGGCGSNYQDNVYASGNCRWTGCSLGGCNSDEFEVDSSWCWYAYNEKCCKKAYTCRTYLSCSPIPNLGVFVPPLGAWNATAVTDQKRNSYIAAILDNYMYEESLGVSGIDAFTNDFAKRVAWRMGATRLWVYYYYRDTEWLFLDTPTSFVVVVRGTEGLLSWDAILSDMTSVVSTSTTDFGGSDVQIGSGFYSAFSDNKAVFLTELARFKTSSTNPNKPLWFTGHSLGGAVATLFAAYANQNGHPVQGAIMFGSPIVGNAGFKAVYPLGSRTYRYEVPDDPVISQPFTLDASNHVGIQSPVPACTASTAATGRRRSLLQDATAAAEPASTGGDSSSKAKQRPPKRTVCGVWQLDNPDPILKEKDLEEAKKNGANPGKRLALGRQETFACDPSAGPQERAADVAATASGKGGRRRELLNFAAHSILTSYTANVYYCNATAAERASLPVYININDL